MRRPVKLSVLVSMALMITTGAAMGQNANTKPGPTFKAKQGPMVKGKARPMVKVGQDLSTLWDGYQTYQRQGGKGVLGKAFKPRNKLLRIIDDRVVIDAVATGDPSVLQAELEALGMQKASRFGRMVSGELPMDMIDYVAALDSLKLARPAYAVTRVGSVDSQGDAAMLSDDARANFGVEGSGVTVGVLSDSFDCSGGGAAADVGSGDLPTGINVLDDSACPGTDEGRAMMQLIHDVAPGADLAFHTAFNGQPDFASGIIELATVAGAKVIVDDVIYLAEPMFQDGIIAQAVDTVQGMGVSYFSSAGNEARASYESPFRASGIFGTHDFDPGAGVDIFQEITVPVGSGFILSFQWDSPFFSVSGTPGSPNDMDIAIVDVTGSICLICAFGIDANVGGDPVEVILFFNDGSVDVDGNPGPDTTFNILIEKYTPAGGPDPNLMKYVRFDLGPGVTIDEFPTTSGTVYGHGNAAGAEAVGAAFYLETPEFGTSPPLVEPYSSAGPTSILFDTSGAPIAPVVRDKPEIIAPDGTNNTLLGFDIPEDPDTFPNFFGTSAAAPHAAGVAALMLEANSSLTPSDVYAVLENTAIDMNDPDTPGPDVGFDYATGYGLIQANLAVGAVSGVDSTPPTVTINQAAGQGDPTNGLPINFTVVFSEDVTGFTGGDVTLGGTAGATTAGVTGGPATYNVAVNSMTGDGTVTASIGAGVAVDAVGNSNVTSTSTDNTVTFDATAPTVTINQAAGQGDPTNGSPINFTVVFSEDVTGFAGGDVTLGGTAGATTAVVSGGPATYNVAVNSMTGDGTVTASIGAGVAVDAVGNSNVASTSTDNTVAFDATAPTVTINQAAGQGDPTNGLPINFTVVFSEDVTGFTGGDVTLGGTAGATTAGVTGGPATYNVAVSGMTGDGTVTASIGAGMAADTAGNPSLASTSIDNTVSFETTGTPTEDVTVTRVRAGNSRVGRNYRIRATVQNEIATQSVAITVRAMVVNNADNNLSQDLMRTVTIAPAGGTNVRFNDSVTLPAGNYTVTITVDEDRDVGLDNTARFRIR